VADDVLIPPEQVGDHPHHLRLQPQQTGEDGGVQSVLGEEHRVGPVDHFADLVPRIVNVGPDPPGLPVQVAGLEALQFGEDFLFGTTFLWEWHGSS
jgi:hypothetical protein